MHPDPSHDASESQVSRRSPAVWSGVALMVGAAPWVVRLIVLFAD